jgi:hypothetical protein
MQLLSCTNLFAIIFVGAEYREVLVGVSLQSGNLVVLTGHFSNHFMADLQSFVGITE